MKAYIIVDTVRPVPNATLQKELIVQGIDYQYWPAIHEPNDPVVSINLSHKEIVSYANRQDMPEICIMEEDVMFTAPDGWQYFLTHKPAEFDLYLGGAYGLSEAEYACVASGSGPVRIERFAGLHCYMISQRYYDTFLNLPTQMHIDNQPGMGVFYVCAPFAALQHPGWSSNVRRLDTDYNCNISPQCIYYGNR
jgi:hypothetical protein